MKNDVAQNGIQDFGYDRGLYFVPLGGSEEFGINLNVYIADGDMLAIDCGLGFADERFPGIDLLLPDPWFLEDNIDALKGMIITHAHEDHIGAVAYLWERFECPLYATAFTASVLRKKLDEQGLRHAQIHILETGADNALSLGAFTIEALPVSHSVPESVSLFIQTDYGNVVHSGDWNLDPAPTVGQAVDAEIFKAVGQRDVLAYIGDSTNAQVDGYSGSEHDVEKGLEATFKDCNGKIVVTSFSSNIGRILSIARAAAQCDRQVAVIGRSLHRMIGCAKECGYLHDIPEFLDEADLGYIPDSSLVVIVTGSQGEYRAALAKIARGDHKLLSLKKGDTVIFSSRAIPGNEREINHVKNNLTGSGIDVITPLDTPHKIHVSGHPCRDEIAQMLQWLKPDTVIPVHGERTQLEAQAAFAKECQVSHTLVPSNGSVICLGSVSDKKAKPQIVDHIETSVLAVDQKRIIPSTHQSITARKKLQYTGALHVSLVLDAKGKLLGSPQIDVVGLIDEDNSGETQILDKLADEVEGLLDDYTWDERLDDHFVAEELRIGLRRFFFHVLGIKPKTTIHVLRV